MEPFLLGISTGWYCLLSCGLYLLPFLFAENSDRMQNARLLALFLGGRLVSYTAVGAAAGYAGLLAASTQAPLFQRLAGISSWLIFLILLAGGLTGSFPSLKPCRYLGRFYKPWLGALMFGVLTGLALCPPFMAAIVAVFAKASVLEGIGYFLWFYLGTSIYFIPLLGVSAKPLNTEKVRDVARIVMLFMAGYFLLKAIAATLT